MGKGRPGRPHHLRPLPGRLPNEPGNQRTGAGHPGNTRIQLPGQPRPGVLQRQVRHGASDQRAASPPPPHPPRRPAGACHLGRSLGFNRRPAAPSSVRGRLRPDCRRRQHQRRALPGPEIRPAGDEHQQPRPLREYPARSGPRPRGRLRIPGSHQFHPGSGKRRLHPGIQHQPYRKPQPDGGPHQAGRPQWRHGNRN